MTNKKTSIPVLEGALDSLFESHLYVISSQSSPAAGEEDHTHYPDYQASVLRCFMQMYQLPLWGTMWSPRGC